MRHHRILSLLAGLASATPLLAAKPLELWIMPNGANPKKIVEERLQAFTKETGIPATVKVLDWGEAWGKIDNGLKTGNGPDVVQLGTTWVSYFASQGYLAPLDGHAAEIKLDRFLATSLKTTKIDGNDTVWGVPWFVDARVLLANKTILDSLKISGKDISDWAGFRASLRKIREAKLLKDGANQIYPFGFPGKSDWNIPHNFIPWIMSEGGDFVKKGPDGKWRSALLEKATVTGIHKYLRFVQDTLVNPKALSQNTSQITQIFTVGEQVFILGTSELVMQSRISSDSGGMSNSAVGKAGLLAFPVPAGPAGSVAFLGGSDLCLPKGKAKDANALKLLLFLTRADNLDIYTKKIGFIPADQTVLQEWAKDSVYKVIVDAAAKGRAYPGIPQWGSIESMLSEMFGSVWGMLGEGGYYSDEDLYKTLVKYDGRIDSLLGAKSAPMPLDSFKLALAAVKDAPAIAEAASKPGAAGGGIPWVPIAAGVVVLGGIGFALSRRKSA